MSLADELLADLEDGGDDGGDDELQAMPNDVEDVDEVSMETEAPGNSVRSVAKLRDCDQLKRVMEQIQMFQSGEKRNIVAGPVEADPEYLLIIKANNITVEIDNEISVIHKFARDHYSKRFPELESLVSTPLEYMKTVRELQNYINNSKSNEVLQEILTSATIMVVSVTASTTQGTVLNSDELNTVLEACDMAIELNKFKLKIFEYVESKMMYIAPNVSIIVGASTAAKIMGLAGGLTNLSKMPACNILVLGSQKNRVTGFSSTQNMPHMGYIYYSELVQKTPSELRKKACRLVAAKCALASRVDSCHESMDGAEGDKFLADVEAKLDKLQEPPPVKTVRALPAPIDVAKKKRGGRRARKMKERLGITEIRKQANRMNFGQIEDDAYQDDLGFSLGNVRKSGSGRVRGPFVDSKTKARISKTLQQKLQKQNNVWGGSTTVRKQISGTASSVAFTPLQGLEIVNPQAAEKSVQETNQKYFSTTSGFVRIAKEMASASVTSKTTSMD